MQVFESSIELPVSIEAAFAYHERPGALQRLIPPWENVVIETSDQSLQPGSRVTLRSSIGGLPMRWIAEHRDYDPPHRFEDVALSGPFHHWHHRHLFRALTANSSLMTDRVEYQLPFGAMSRRLGGGYVRRQLEAMFAYRHRVTRSDLATAARYSLSPMKIAITGAGGLLGSELSPFLSLLGHRSVPAQRSGEGAQTSFQLAANHRWDDCDVVIHLAGKSIAEQRWSESVKAQIRDSRVAPTRRLCQQLAELSNPPKLLICASATGIYGDRGDELVDESSQLGDDFLANVAAEWEAACDPARQAGIRVVHLRLGVVLSPRGGALSSMLLPARLGLGGPIGGGKQWWSWIAMDDVLGAIYHAIANDAVAGAMNAVAPTPVRNREFAADLGAVLGRPAFVPAPAPVLRLALGQMADDLLLSSTRVEPGVLTATGYDFRFTKLEPALRHLLGRSEKT